MVQALEPHARKCLRVCEMRAVRCAVYTSRRSQRNRHLLVSENLEKSNCAQYTFHSVDDHQAAEEDDSEEDHHIQPDFGSTVHAAGFPDCWNCCPGLDRTWRLGRIVELISYRPSSASRFISQSFVLLRDSLVLTSWVRMVLDFLSMVSTTFRTFVFLAK